MKEFGAMWRRVKDKMTSGNVVVVFITLICVVPVVSAEESNTTRLGISLGGIHAVGLDFEYHSKNNSIGLSIGTWLFHDICLSLSARRYLRSSGSTPCVGLGLWSALSFSDKGTGNLMALCFPAGIEWRMFEKHSLGLEIDSSYLFAQWGAAEVDEPPLRRRFVFIPNLYYKARIWNGD